jgi:hypothetical protein
MNESCLVHKVVHLFPNVETSHAQCARPGFWGYVSLTIRFGPNQHQTYFGCGPRLALAYCDSRSRTEIEGHALLQCRVPTDLTSAANFMACNDVLSCG